MSSDFFICDKIKLEGEMSIKKDSARVKTEEFFAGYRERHFSKGQIIIFPDETSPLVYFLTEGKIKKYSVNYKGDEIILTVFRPGSFLPIAESIDQPLKNRYFYAAESDVITHVAPKNDVVEMLKKNPDIMMALLHRVNRGLAEFLDRALSLMAGNALSRVGYEIYVEASRFGTDEKTGKFIEINERTLAARTGLTRETVNREIRKLKQINALKVERRGILVTDMSSLEKKLYKKLL